MFLDHLQWADLPSLLLLEHLMLDADLKHLLLVGAYRDNEVLPGHHLLVTVGALQQAGARVSTLTLSSLRREHCLQLLTELDHLFLGGASLDDVRELAARSSHAVIQLRNGPALNWNRSLNTFVQVLQRQARRRRTRTLSSSPCSRDKIVSVWAVSSSGD